MNNNKKDEFIRKKFEQDILMSSSTSNTFKHFFEKEIPKMENEKKVVEFESKEMNNNSKKKKIMGTAAAVTILFLGANVYAATQGYNNIFFAIKNLFTTVSVSGKSEILTDKEMIISYNPIELAHGVRVEVNKLTVQDNKAMLTVTLRHDENLPFKQKIHKVSYGTLGNQKLTDMYVYTADSTIIQQDFRLFDYNDDTEEIYMSFESSEKIVGTLKVNLVTKEIEVLESSINNLEKISEVDLKKALGEYVLLNEYRDGIIARSGKVLASEDEEINYKLVQIAMNKILEKEVSEGIEEIKYTKEKVNKAIEEIAGIVPNANFEFNFNDAYAYISYDKENDEYKYNGEDGYIKGYCLEILDISFENGVYTVKFVYNYPSDYDWIDGNIENLDQFETQMKFTLNDNYEYTRYCLQDVYNISSKVYKIANESENNSVEIPNNNSNTTNQTTTQNTVSISSNNTVNYTNTAINTTLPITNQTSSSNFGVNTVVANQTTTINTTNTTTTISPINNNMPIDNYASSMNWTTKHFVGMSMPIPTDWQMSEKITNFNGDNGGQMSASVGGQVVGINRETNEPIYSNLKFWVYVPEFIKETDLETYAKKYCEENSLYYTGCGYSNTAGINWVEIYDKNPRGAGSYRETTYLHIEETYGANGVEGILYKVIAVTDNYANYKVTNILNKVIPSIKFGSF